eukprot:jgi/Mesen1/8366/ME000464S07771
MATAIIHGSCPFHSLIPWPHIQLPHGEKAFTYLFEHTRKKAGPIEEFRWLGLMLFVAVLAQYRGMFGRNRSVYLGAPILGCILGQLFWCGGGGPHHEHAVYARSQICSCGRCSAVLSLRVCLEPF